MGLKEVKKELEDKIEKAVEIEKAEEKTALEALETAITEPVKEEVKEEVKAEEKQEIKEEAKSEVKAEEKTGEDFRKERQARKDRQASELAEAKERIARLESLLKPVEVAKSVTDPEPNKASNPVEWADWRVRQAEKKLDTVVEWKKEQETKSEYKSTRERALQEVAVYENEVIRSTPDYNDIKQFMVNFEAMKIKSDNPDITNEALLEQVTDKMLNKAAYYFKKGYENPVEPMIEDAKRWGYQPKAKEETKETKEEPKPDLDKVSKLRSRNAGMAGASGSGGEADITPTVALGMTNAQFAKLKPEQKKKIFDRLKGVA